MQRPQHHRVVRWGAMDKSEWEHEVQLSNRTISYARKGVPEKQEEVSITCRLGSSTVKPVFFSIPEMYPGAQLLWVGHTRCLSRGPARETLCLAGWQRRVVVIWRDRGLSALASLIPLREGLVLIPSCCSVAGQ